MRVLFVNMPFAGLRPAIGVSLLIGHLERVGIAAECAYLNLQFARRVGGPDYDQIAERAPTQALAGDWVFAESAFGERRHADGDYLATYSRRFGPSPNSSELETLRRCRAAAAPFIEECLDAVEWQSFDLIGFTSTFAQHVASLALARRVKERFPGLTIVFGGANCEAEMGVALHRAFPFVDFVCSGEADVSFPQLCLDLADGGTGEGIPGVIWRREGQTEYLSLAPGLVADLDTLPYPDYRDFFAEIAQARPEGMRRLGVLMEASRGCWWGQKHHCTFCGLNGTAMAYRSKTAARVLEEMSTLSARYSPHYVEMVDNIMDMHYFHDLVPELKRRQLDLGLFFEVKANLTKQQLGDLWDAGIRTIQPGIESLSTDVLRRMRKGTTALQNVQLLKWCKELGITAYWNLLFGFPGEDPSDYAASAAVIDAIGHLQPPSSLGQIRLDRFSPNFFDAETLGIRNVRPDRSYASIYPLSTEALAELAYYFEYDYADGRDPEAYVGSVRAAVSRWHRDSGGRGLVYQDHGASLAVWDLRPRATRTVTVLASRERAIYLFCDQGRRRDVIESYLRQSTEESVAARGEDLEGTLSALVADRLMISLDDHYLSLAVPAFPSGNEHDPRASPARGLPVLS